MANERKRVVESSTDAVETGRFGNRWQEYENDPRERDDKRAYPNPSRLTAKELGEFNSDILIRHSRIPRFHNSGFQIPKDSRFQIPKDSRFQRIPDSRIQDSRTQDSRFQDSKGFRDSKGFQDSKGFRDSKGFQDSRFQDSKIPGFQDSRIPGFQRIPRIQNPKSKIE
ncbi:MAG: hypothetical protein IPN69_23460 [Acidobacteria bacterium]|nr:hypothetical protein [Acidobacteriota bacterium]